MPRTDIEAGVGEFGLGELGAGDDYTVVRESVSLSGAALLTASGRAIARSPGTSLAGVGTLSGDPRALLHGSTITPTTNAGIGEFGVGELGVGDERRGIYGQGTLSVSGRGILRSPGTSLAGVGTLSGDPRALLRADLEALSGAGVLTASGTRIRLGAVGVTGVGALAARGQHVTDIAHRRELTAVADWERALTAIAHTDRDLVALVENDADLLSATESGLFD